MSCVVSRLRRMLPLGVAFWMAAGVAAADDEALHTLRYKFAEGEVVHFKASHSVVLTHQKESVREVARNDAQTWKHYRVASVTEDGSATLELVIDRVRMMVRFNDEDPLRVDSARPQEDCPAPYKSVLKTIGLPTSRIEVTASGQLLDSKPLLPKHLQPKVTPGNGEPTPADDPGKNPFPILPGQPVRVGDTWSDDITVQVAIPKSALRVPATIRRKYKLQSVDGDLAKISLETALLTPIRDPQMQVQLIQRTPQGTIEFDLAKGNVVSRTMTVDETVVGALGESSSAHAAGELTETLLTPDDAADQTAAVGGGASH